jgi:hypothetical protein
VFGLSWSLFYSFFIYLTGLIPERVNPSLTEEHYGACGSVYLIAVRNWQLRYMLVSAYSSYLADVEPDEVNKYMKLAE